MEAETEGRAELQTMEWEEPELNSGLLLLGYSLNHIMFSLLC
jgi:hypothetical protein